jgi:hypothetical protein
MANDRKPLFANKPLAIRVRTGLALLTLILI